MSSDFEGYEQDFSVLTAEITNRVGKVPKLLGGESWEMELGGRERNVCPASSESVFLATLSVGMRVDLNTVPARPWGRLLSGTLVTA